MNVKLEFLIKRLVKFLIEGFVIGFSLFLIPKTKYSLNNVLWYSFLIAIIFNLQDVFTPYILTGTQFGIGFFIAYNILK
jgi:hypothetical protein